MLKKKRVLGYCPIGNNGSISPFDKIFSEKKDISKDISDVDAVIFWGGTDIDPSLYNEKAHPLSQARGRSDRDRFEWRAMLYCKEHNIPMIGVCRGAQLMCAFAGGRLVQHCSGHNQGNHTVLTNDNDVFITSSCHHQMMEPSRIEHEMLAWSREKMSAFYLDGNCGTIQAAKDGREPEVVYFPTINGLGIQGHPEWMPENDPFVEWCLKQVEEKLFVKSLA